MKQFYYILQKGLCTIAFFLLFSPLAKAQTLTLGSVDAGPYTPGSTIAVPFSISSGSSCIDPNNVFTLYISSVPGGTPDTPIGSYSSFYAAFVNGTIPSNLAPGSYNLAIKSSLPAVTSSTATINIVAGTPITAGISGASINSDNPEIFGNCSGSNNPYGFVNASSSGTTATASFRNEFDQSSSGPYTLNPGTTFSAGYTNYTILVKATDANGNEGTKAYQLINNNINTNFGTTGSNTVCLSNGHGQLSYTVDYTSPNGIQYNYPGNLYVVNWGDGSQTVYTLCDIINLQGRLTHDYTQTSCGNTVGTQNNSFQVNAQVSSRICGTLGSPTSVYAKVVRPPSNGFTSPNSACLNEPVTFYNNSDAGQDASSTAADCENTNAQYSWYIDGQLVAVNQPRSASFTYTFTTSGQHTIKLVLQSQSGSVCSAADVTKTICILAKPQPAFSVSASTICSNDIVSTTDQSVIDHSCDNIPQNNVYNWTVTGPGSTVFVNNTTAASHQPEIQFSSPGLYTLTLSISTETCGAVSTSQTITVNTTPTVTLSADKEYCGTNITLAFSNAASPTQTIFTGTTTDQANTYSWTVTGGNYSYADGTGSISKYPHILFTDFGVYTVTAAETNNCGTASDSQQITFLQSPTINAGPDQTICPNGIVQLAGTISNPQPQSYQWVGGNGTFSPDRMTLNAIYTPSNAEIDAGQVSLNLVAITGYPSPCDQLFDEIIITINPRNAVNSAASKTICAGSALDYHITADVNGSTFTWTSSASTGVSGNSASGSGDYINDLLNSSDPTNDGTVVYTITPTSNGCPGTPFTLTVTITPKPVITITSTSNTICSGQMTGITFTSNITGTLFEWTTTATTDIHGNNPQTPVNASRIDDLLTNTSTTTSGTATYIITPIGPSGCAGTPVTVTITVQPLPVQATAGPDQDICAASNYTLQGNDPGVSSGTWTLVSNQTGVTFANAHQYNTTANGLQPGQLYTFRWTITGASPCAATSDDVSINDLSDLTNHISFANPSACYGQTVTILGDPPTGGTNTYTYSWESSTDNINWTPLSGQNSQDLSVTLSSSTYFRRTVTSLPCTKISNTVYIAVQPSIGSNSVTADQQICYNTVPAELTGSTPTGGGGNYSYQWQSSTDNGFTFNNIGAANGINYQPVALTGTTQFQRIVTTVLCSGPQSSTSNIVTVTVSPQNTNTLTSAPTGNVCTGTTFSYHPTAQAANTSFTWVSSASANVTGNSATGSGDINDVLVNSDPNSNGTVIYTITPSNNGCPGPAFTLTVTVVPRPVISVNTTSNTICSGQPTGITFTSNLSGTLFTWTTTATAGINGNNNSAPVNTDRIIDVLTNSSATTSGTATYTITPIGPSGCDGTPITVTITVQPLPVQANAGPDENICAAPSYTLQGNNPGISSGTWTSVSGQAGILFTNPSQYNTTVSGLQPGQLYTFRWTITGSSQCATSYDDVNINDLQDLTNTISFGNPAVCYGQTITITGGQPNGGTGTYTYSWESSTDNINFTVLNGQNNRDLTFTATQDIYVRRIVNSTPCVKISQPVYIIVQPQLANNNIYAGQRICYNNVPTALTGDTPTGGDGNYAYQWQISTNGGNTWTNISGATSSGYQPGTLTATTMFRRTVTTILCNGPQSSTSNIVTITVDPPNTNTLTSASSATVCTRNALVYHPTAQQNGTVFTWVSSASANISGNSATGSGDINDVLVNSDPNNYGTVVYTITPINNNCPAAPFTLTVTVAPLPVVTLTSTGNQICSGQRTGITFTTNLTRVSVKWTFDPVQGIYGANNQYPVVATRIDDLLTSDLTSPATVTYHITPISEDGCIGTTVDATVTVLPQPVAANAGPDEAVCNVNSYVLKGNDPSPSTGKWTVTSGQATVGFADDTRYNTTVNGLQPGQNYTFRWTITSTGACSTSSDDVTISDLPALTNNISFSAPAVCYGQTITVTGDRPTGGTGTYAYAWENSTDNVSWTTIADQTGAGYSFTGTESIFIRRIVSSGPCVQISSPVHIIVQPAISNNIIGSNQQVCYNDVPSLFSGSVASGADGNYSYQWQSSKDNGAIWTNIAGATMVDYQAGNLTITTIFRRNVTSALCTGPQQSISNIVTVIVNPLPDATFTYTADLGCIPFAIDAANIKATAAPGNQTYSWYADNVLIGNGVDFPGYTITTDSTHVTIKLVVTSKFGCPDASFSHVFSTRKEVTAGFGQDQIKGCGPLTVTFNNTSNPQNAATYHWDFGNGMNSTLANPNPVTFKARPDGKDTTYQIKLTAYTSCGIRTFASTVTVRPKPTSIFTPDKTIGCSPLTINLNNTSPGTGNTYTYDFGDGETLTTTDNHLISHTYTSSVIKNYVVRMVAQNECGSDTSQYIIRITPSTVLPQLVVNGNQKAGCAPWTVQFYNNTKGGIYFTYDFGDGTTVNTLTAPEVVSHTFLKDGIYNVKLTATNGCSDTSVYQSITVYAQPVVGFTSDVQKGCNQLTVNFESQTAGNNSYSWDFGDGGTSALANPQHTFTARSTPYTVTLVATNTLGCMDTLAKKNYITVHIPPSAAFIARPDSVIAYPNYSFSFADRSTNNPILWKWDFGDGSTVSKQNPNHTYLDTGSYRVKLVVYDLYGCADTVTHLVQITGVPGQLFVPNAFMPTSKFQEILTFKAKGSGIAHWRMRVFNKWGQVIWESTKLTERGEPAEGWDGMMNGQPAPQGVYVWQIDATFINGEEWKGMSYKGSTPSRTGVIHLIQ